MNVFQEIDTPALPDLTESPHAAAGLLVDPWALGQRVPSKLENRHRFLVEARVSKEAITVFSESPHTPASSLVDPLNLGQLVRSKLEENPSATDEAKVPKHAIDFFRESSHTAESTLVSPWIWGNNWLVQRKPPINCPYQFSCVVEANVSKESITGFIASPHGVNSPLDLANAPKEAVTVIVWRRQDLGKSSKATNPHRARATDFLEVVYLFDRVGETRRAVEHVVDHADTLLNEGLFEECETILREADVSKISPSSLVSLLGVTLAAKKKLGISRRDFIARATFELVKQLGKDRADLLLSNYA